MSNVYLDIRASDIKNAVRKRVKKPVEAIGKDPRVMRLIANKAVEIVKPYVPMKSGKLRESAHVSQHAHKTMAVWGKAGVGKTRKYAAYQHNSDDRWWKRTTSGTMSFWTKKVMPGSMGYRKLITYATPLVKKEVRKRGSR